MALTAAASDSEPAVSSAPLVKGRDGSDSDPERVTATSESATEIESLAAAGLPTAGGLSDIEKTEERDRLSARVFDLENRLRETEEELEYYFDFYKKARRGKRGGTTNASNRRDGLSDTRKSEKKGDGERETAGARDDDSDSDLEDGAAPGNQNYTEPWSKTLGRNAALEYTRDSPMFRKRLWAFQETLKPLQGHSVRVLERAEEYCTAGENFRQKGVSLAEELSSKEASRLMFSNNFRGLGDLAANMSSFSTALKQVHELLVLLVDSVRSGLAAPLLAFKEGFRDLDGLAEELHTRGKEYESRLSKALDQKDLPVEGPLHDKAARARWDFELYRFDLVRYMNQLDAKKVLLLETGINNTFYAMLAYFQGGAEICYSQEKVMRRRQAMLDGMNKRYDGDNALWAYVRSRLEAELQGALPPPGAPPGARAPINPRASCPVYVAALTTEVLSADSLEASPTDMAHCSDEGVLKQGYLFKRQVLGRKERCWYRLHESKLFTLELGRAAAGDVPVCVFELGKGATVAKRPGKVPFCFLLVRDDGYRLELQAESEDEMLKWMSAIRRCQRFFAEEKDGTRFPTGSRGEPRSGTTPGRKMIGLRADGLMDEFRAKNGECAECRSPDIEWASINIGITLCSACAAIHRTLGSTVSNVRSLKLDPWSVFVLQSLLEDLGNEKAREIWECNVSPGWTKPSHDAGAQDREQWIVAKYRWFGFVGEDTRDSPLISKAMHHAAARGDVERIMWCVAHKGEVNSRDPAGTGRTPLHAACEADQRRAVAVLLLNGASMYATDEKGISTQDMVAHEPYSDIARLLAEKERGELW